MGRQMSSARREERKNTAQLQGPGAFLYHRHHDVTTQKARDRPIMMGYISGSPVAFLCQ